MFSEQLITIPHSKDLFFHVHSRAFNSFIFTLMWKSKVLSNFEWCVTEITELWEAELLGSLILINVVPRVGMVVQSLGHF